MAGQQVKVLVGVKKTAGVVQGYCGDKLIHRRNGQACLS